MTIKLYSCLSLLMQSNQGKLYFKIKVARKNVSFQPPPGLFLHTIYVCFQGGRNC